MDWSKLIELSPYELTLDEKSKVFDQALYDLSLYHYQQCDYYREIIDLLYREDFNHHNVTPLAARLFKHHLLSSISDSDIFKVTTSSGTTSQQVSRIVLDKENIVRQQKVLSRIVQQWLGKKRLPMLIIDHPNVIKNKQSYSARGVGIQGLSIFGHDHTYALNEDMSLNMEAIKGFVSRYQDEKVFIFGFTYMIWQYFIKALETKKQTVHLPLSVSFHSGGWKKLQEQSVSNNTFNSRLSACLQGGKVHNFYGMVEQTGTIYVECEAGYFHCSVWSDIKIRSLSDLSFAKVGEKGLVEVNSLLPTSYPGHAILTEDLGTLIGTDDCCCGKKGKYFSIHGRLPASEVRGCSDTQS